MAKEILDPYLDHLYNSNVRCPYCRRRILRYTTICERCGVHKRQIAEASNQRAKEIKKQRSGARLFMSRSRPKDVTFTAMAMYLLFLGLFGGHRFYVGRKLSAWIIIICIWVGLIGVFAVPMHVRESGNIMWQGSFPTDLFLVAGVLILVYDWAALLLGFFAYPIRLGEEVADAKDKPKK